MTTKNHKADTLNVMLPNYFETSKVDWMLNNIKIENISRFLEQYGPHFELNSRTFNCSMPKEGNSGLICERNFM